jgi:phosphoribosylformylglycinamidine (FGAM) synthase PurS component
MYGLKSYLIKQISTFRREIIDKAKHKETIGEAIKNFAVWSFYSILAGTPTYMLLRWLLDDEDEEQTATQQIVDVMFNNILLNNLINEYNLKNAKRDPVGLLFNQVSPTFVKPLTNLSKDVMDAIISEREIKYKFLKNISIVKDVRKLKKKWID